VMNLNAMTRIILSLLLISTVALPAFGDSYSALFIIERSTNKNVIHYDAKFGKDGKLDPKNPVVAYWIMAAQDGRRESLTFIERRKAYGFTINRDGSSGTYRMTLVSQKQREIRIYQQGDSVHAETFIDGHAAYLTKIYVKTRKAGLLRTADYYELFGTDIATGAECYEKVMPQP
jgi:uncharacterized protein DUF4833